MRFKGTFILLIVFVVLGGYVYLTEFRGQEQRQSQEEAKKKLFSIDAKDIAEITLSYPDLKISAVRKSDKPWEITAPSGVEADSEEWDRLASDIARVERESTVAAEAGELAQYGLDRPAITVTAKLTDGQSLGVSFGGQNPRKTFAYAKVSDKPEVFLTPVPTSFQKTVTDLRNKKILDVDVDNVDSIMIADGASELEIHKSGMDWMLKKPIAAKADSTQVTTFLSTVHGARASDFADAAESVKDAGLDPASTTITFHDAKAGADRILLIGKSKETDKYFARDAARSAIFILDKQLLETVRRPIFDWRDKSIASFDSEAIDEIELLRGSEKVSMKKTGMDWTLADGRKLQWDKISGMLSALQFQRAKRIIDSPKPLLTYGLDKPRLEATFRKAGTNILDVKLGAVSTDPEGIYLKSASAGSVLVVPGDLADTFSVKVDELVETKPKIP